MRNVKNLIICTLMLALASTAAGQVIHVPEHYNEIQDAIEVAIDGWVIEVAPGTYNEAIDFKGKAITLRSSDGPENTIIDANDKDASVVTCENCGPGTSLSGFTLTGGTGTMIGSHKCGGGMYNYNSSPTLRNCIFSNNTAIAWWWSGGCGGGMYNKNSYPTLFNCTFSKNVAKASDLYQGEGGMGGGMHNDDSNTRLSNCTFSENVAEDATWLSPIYDDPGLGGGMYNSYSSPEVTYNSTFENNSPDGMYNTNSSPSVTDCTFSGNTDSGMYNGGGSPIVTDCTFSGNTGSGMDNGGGSPIVTNCTFSGNTGSGMDNGGGSPIVTNCTFRGNTAGGMDNLFCNPTVTDCTFEGNSTSGSGGGMSNIFAWTSVKNCTFTDNMALLGYGGGMYNGECNPTVTNCTFSTNSANNGGGMFNSLAGPSLTNCIFTDNEADDYGGGVGNDLCNPTVTNCTFTGNVAWNGGGGMSNFWAGPSLTNCTLSGNMALLGYGGGMRNWACKPTVTNCIMWGDLALFGSPEIDNDWLSGTTVTYSDIQGGWGGEGNKDINPMFADDDKRLSPGSPCIDAGNNSAVSAATDLDGNPRITDGNFDAIAVVDMGAYEYVDVDADDDGIEDSIDTEPFVYSDDFDDGTTTGTIMERGEQTVVVVDEPNPDGVRIEAKTPGGAEPAQISVCDEAAFTLDAGDVVIETCGSVEITVVQGMVEIVFFADDGSEAQTILNAGNTVKFEPETFTFTAPSTNSEEVIVFVDGVEIVLAPGEIKMFIRAGINIDPDTLNLKSKGTWLTCYIALPQGFDVSDIDVGTVMLNGQVPAELHPVEVSDYDSDGVADLMVKFDLAATQAILEVGDAVQISVSGELNDGTVFEGSDTIRVIEPGGQNK